MNKITKTVGILSILATLCLTNTTICKAVTESMPTIKDNSYSKTVTLKKSEEQKYLKNIEEQIEVGENKYILNSTQKTSEPETNKKVVTKEQKLDTLFNTSNKETLKSNFSETITFNEDGFIGNISLKDVKVETVPQGQYEKIETLDIPFSGYTPNELATIEKEINEKGYDWTLKNVDWQVETTKTVDGTEVPVTYSGVKHYHRVGVYNNPSKYRATAIYEGEVQLEDPESVYEISYTKEEQEEKQPEVVNEEPKQNIAIPILIVGGIGLLIILFALLAKKKVKEQNK